MKKTGLFALAMGLIPPLILLGVSLSAATPAPSDTSPSTRTPSASTRPSTRPALPPPHAKTVQAVRAA